MSKKIFINRNIDGSLVLPAHVLNSTMLKNHSELMMIEEESRMILVPSIHSLSRLYIEPTSTCNLNCVTCIRSSWHEESGFMDMSVFNALIEQVREFKTIESVMFSGFGEPLSHPDILQMIKAFSDLGINTEVTTNGTLLDDNMIDGLFDAGLQDLWVSIDSVTSNQFNEIREGGDFDQVYSNLKKFKLKNKKSKRKIILGIAFVATKDNVEEMSKLRGFAGSVWAERISVSNVIPYDREMEEKMLCKKKLFKPLAYREDQEDRIGFKEIVIPEISLPKMDYTSETKDALFDIHSSMMKIKKLDEPFNENKDYCRFINKGNSFIRWDGMVTPCMGLIHSYKTYLNGNERTIKSHTLGNIAEKSLMSIWRSEAYRQFREDVMRFEFSPCVLCGGCQEGSSNEKDCLKNDFPVCGGCLWAQGVIQCP